MTSPPTRETNQSPTIPSEPPPSSHQSNLSLQPKAQHTTKQTPQSKTKNPNKHISSSTTMKLSHTNTQLDNRTSINNTDKFQKPITITLTPQQQHHLSTTRFRNSSNTSNIPIQMQSDPPSRDTSIPIRNRPSLPPILINDNQTSPTRKPAPSTFETNPSPEISPDANPTMEQIHEDLSLSPSSDIPTTTIGTAVPIINISAADPINEPISNIDPTASTPREGKRRSGRPPNINENSLIRRLQCVMAVEFECVSMNLACEFYKISSRTFYRWLRNKKRLLELTGYRPEDFAIGGCMDVTKYPIIPAIEAVNKSFRSSPNTSQPQTNGEKDTNLSPSNLSRMPSQPPSNGQNNRSNDEGHASDLMNMTKNDHTPDTVDDSAGSKNTRKPVDENKTTDVDAENAMRSPTVTEVRLELARSTTRMRATLNPEPPVRKHEDGDRNTGVDGSGTDSHERLLKRRRFSPDISQGQPKEARDWQGSENLDQVSRQTVPSREAQEQINSTRNSAGSLGNGDNPTTHTQELTGQNNASMQKETTRTTDRTGPTEPTDPTLLPTETSRECMVTRGGDGENRRQLVYPAQYQCIDSTNHVHTKQMEYRSFMNMQPLHREHMCPHTQIRYIEHPSSAQVELHRLEIMHGRRREVIKWYDGTPVEEIKEAVMLRFGLPPKLRWSLLDRSNEEVLVSTHVESGKYTLNVYQ